MTKIFRKFEKKVREEKKKLTEETLKKEKLKKEKLKKKKKGLKTQRVKKNADSTSHVFSKRDTFIRILNCFRKREVLSIKIKKATDIENMNMISTHTIHTTNECKSNEIKLVNEKFINKVKEEFFERCISENPCPAIKTLRRRFSFNEALSEPPFNETFPAESSSREKLISTSYEVKSSTSSVRLEKLPSINSVPRVKNSTKASLTKPSTNTSSLKSPTKASIETLSSEKTISLSSEKFSPTKRLLPPSATPIAEPFGSIDQILDLWLMPISSFTKNLQKSQNEKKMNLRNEVAAKISYKKSDPLSMVEDIFRRTQNLEEVFDLPVDIGYEGASELLEGKGYLKSGPIHLKPENILVKDQKINEADLNSVAINHIADMEIRKIGSKSTIQPTDSMEHKLIQKFIFNKHVDSLQNSTYQKSTQRSEGLVLNISDYLETNSKSCSPTELSSTTKISSSQDISMRPFKLQNSHYKSEDLQLESFPTTLSRKCYETRKGLPFRLLT